MAISDIDISSKGQQEAINELVGVENKMITVWKNGTWKVWEKGDAHYATNDEDWLVNIPLCELSFS